MSQPRLGLSPLELELGLQVDVSDTLAARGIDTAERVKARKPEIWRACKLMLGAGITPKKIEQLLSLDIRIVLSIQGEGEADGSIPPYKERTLKQLRSIITLGLDELLEKAKEGKIDPISMCALIDKVELLSGGVTSRAAMVEDPRVAEFRRFMEASAVRGMVSEVGDVFQRGGGGGVVEIGAGGALEMPTGDIVSPAEVA